MPLDTELDRLLSAYRAATPDPEPSADFMPGLWRKIEARNSFFTRMRRWTQATVAVAGAACAFMMVVAFFPSGAPDYYVEVLAADVEASNQAYSEAQFHQTSWSAPEDQDRSLETFAQ
jgi:hypothetical protein